MADKITCAAPGCPNIWSRNVKKSFHCFPPEPARCQQWLKFCGLEDKYRVSRDVHGHVKLCIDHFEKGQYLISSNGSVRLLRNAVPSIYNHRTVRSSFEVHHQVSRTNARKARKHTKLFPQDRPTDTLLMPIQPQPRQLSLDKDTSTLHDYTGVTFGKMDLFDMNMSTLTMNQTHIGFDALGCSKNIVDDMDEQQHIHKQIEYKYGYVSSEVEEESSTGCVKKESHSCSPERYSPFTMQQEVHIKQEENVEEKVQNVDLPEFIHCNAHFPGTSSNSMIQHITNVKEEPDPIECDNTDFDLKQEIKEELDDFRQEIKENLDQIFEEEIAQNEDGMLEECCVDFAPSYATDPLLLSYNNTFNEQENGLSSTFLNNVDECAIEVKPALYEPDPLIEGSETHCTQPVNSSNLQDSVNEKCSKNLNSELHEAESLKDLCRATTKDPEKEYPAGSNNRQIFVRKTYSKKKSVLDKAYLLIDGHVTPYIDSETESLPENSVDFQNSFEEECSIEVKPALDELDPLVVGSGTNCTQPVNYSNLQENIFTIFSEDIVEECSIEVNPALYYEPEPSHVGSGIDCTQTVNSSNLQTFARKTYSKKKSTLNKACLLMDGHVASSTDSDKDSQPKNSSDLQKSPEDKKAVSCYEYKKVSGNGKMSLYEFRKALASLMENRPIKYIRRRCYFPGCSSNDRNSKVFAFPRNLERTQDWLQRIGHSSSLDDCRYFAHRKVLCCKHFADEFFQSSKLRNKLKNFAVPFFWSPIYSKDVALHNES